MTYHEKEMVLIEWLKKQVTEAQEAQKTMLPGEGRSFFEGQENQAKWTLNLLLDLSGQAE